MPNNPERRKFLQLASALTGAAALGGPLAVKFLLEAPPPVKTSGGKKPPEETKKTEPPQPPATATAIPATPEVKSSGEWDANTLEALRWVAKNRPFGAPYDKYTMRLGEYTFGLHGFRDYNADSRTWLRIWWGVDLVGQGDKTIHAPFEGIVAAVGEEKPYGFWIDIKSPKGNWWYRAHHVAADSRLKIGVKVSAGNPIAKESSAHGHTHNGLLWKDPKGVWQVVPLAEVISKRPISTYVVDNDQITISKEDIQFFLDAQPGKQETTAAKESKRPPDFISPLDKPWEVINRKHTYIPIAVDIAPVDLDRQQKYIVYLPFSGTIEVSPRQDIVYWRTGRAGDGIGGYGNMVTLKNGSFWLRMAHFADNPSAWKFTFDQIKDGSWVEIGTPIGYLGETGITPEGPQIHIELKKDGVFVQPEDFVSNYNPATAKYYQKP